jgi:hypothetical protein
MVYGSRRSDSIHLAFFISSSPLATAYRHGYSTPALAQSVFGDRLASWKSGEMTDNRRTGGGTYAMKR